MFIGKSAPWSSSGIGPSPLFGESDSGRGPWRPELGRWGSVLDPGGLEGELCAERSEGDEGSMANDWILKPQC
jgi:hypothetical protein